MSSQSFLPHLPLDPAWIEQHPAFLHPDATLSRALVKLILAAWRGCPVGSIPSSHSYIADVTGLGVDRVAQVYTVLTDGFELRDDRRLHHIHLAKVMSDVMTAHGRLIEDFRTAWILSMQDSEQFELVGAEVSSAKSKAPRGKVSLPKGFGYEMFPGLLPWVVELGYESDDQQREIMAKFIDFAGGRGEKYKAWDMAFRTYVRKEIEYGRGPSQPHAVVRQGAGRSGFGGLVRGAMSKGDRVVAHNEMALDQAEQIVRQGRQWSHR